MVHIVRMEYTNARGEATAAELKVRAKRLTSKSLDSIRQAIPEVSKVECVGQIREKELGGQAVDLEV